MLAGFGFIPYKVFFEKHVTEINIATIFSIVMAILFLLGIFSIFWFTLIVHIDKSTQKITFNYPFRFQKTTFDFQEIVGFRFKYLFARIDYKAIQFRTKNNKTFTFSDFETENLREIEELCFETFELRADKAFKKLNETQKRKEIEESRQFDTNQAKEIRFALFAVIVFCLFIIVKSIQEYITIEMLTTKSTLLTISSTIIIFASIKKLIKTNKRLKNSA